MLILDEERVRSVLRMEDLIPAMEKALIDFSAGRVTQPVRNMLAVEEFEGFFAPMPVITEDAMGVKLISYYPRNEAKGLPTHHAMIVLFRPETGESLVMMEARLITEMRTAAVSAAATDVMASPDAETLAILGSGAQARNHFEALSLVRRFEDIRVWSRTTAHAKRFAGEIGAKATSAEDAIRGADVVVTATSAMEPILQGAWLKPGAHVNAIGAPRPAWRELDDAAMGSIVVVDSLEAVSKESGDVILSKTAIHAELGEVLAGTKTVDPGKTTIFKSVGLAVEDIASAKLVYDRTAR
ncbi:MAG: ornithine cyclodeaminase family protein [Rhodospirillales bacterium]